MMLNLSLLCFLFLSSPQIAKHVKKEIVWLVDNNGKKLNKENETEYNIQGDVVRQSENVRSGPVICSVIKYEYKDGHKTSSIKTGCKVGREDLTTYIYDRSGRLIQQNELEGRDKLIQKQVHHYSGGNANKTFSETFYDNEISPSEKTTYEYYTNGLLKKDVQTAGGAWFLTNEYKYDDKKNLIYKGSQADGGVGLVKYFYTYQNNVLISDKVIVPDTGTEYHVYERTYY